MLYGKDLFAMRNSIAVLFYHRSISKLICCYLLIIAVLLLLKAVLCGSKLHWKNMPYSQAGSSSHITDGPFSLPAELRNSMLKNQTALSKNATIVVKKPVNKIGQLLHGSLQEPRARKPVPGSMTQFMLDNDLLPDLHGHLQPNHDAHDQCSNNSNFNLFL